MALLDKLYTLSAIVSIGATVYDQHAQRKRARESDEKDRRIRDLEERLARLEAASRPPDGA